MIGPVRETGKIRFIPGVFFLLIIGCTGGNSNSNSIKKKPDSTKKTVKTCENKKLEFAVNLGTVSQAMVMPQTGASVSYIENMRLKDRTIERQRYKTVIYAEPKAEIERFYLAVLLWRWAQMESASVSVKPGKNSSREEILNYRRKMMEIENHRKESIFHLEYLVRRKKISPAILERYAYYSAVMYGGKAIPVFYRLITYKKVPDFRYYVADFTNLLLSENRCEEARTILGKGLPRKLEYRKKLLIQRIWLCDSKGLENKNFSIWNDVCAEKDQHTALSSLPLLASFYTVNSFLNIEHWKDEGELLKNCSILKNDIFLSQFRYMVKQINNSLGLTEFPFLTFQKTEQFYAQLGKSISPWISFLLWLNEKSSSVLIEVKNNRIFVDIPGCNYKNFARALEKILNSKIKILKTECPDNVRITYNFSRRLKKTYATPISD